MYSTGGLGSGFECTHLKEKLLESDAPLLLCRQKQDADLKEKLRRCSVYLQTNGRSPDL
jgi:hypothetical protein